MVRSSKGTFFRSRNIMRKAPREKGRPALAKILTDFRPGDKVDIILESSVQKGVPHRRFHGKTADISEKRGHSYVLSVRDGNKSKVIFSRPEHLKKHVE